MPNLAIQQQHPTATGQWLIMADRHCRCARSLPMQQAGARASRVQDEPGARHPVDEADTLYAGDSQGAPHPGTQTTCGRGVAQ